MKYGRNFNGRPHITAGRRRDGGTAKGFISIMHGGDLKQMKTPQKSNCEFL